MASQSTMSAAASPVPTPPPIPPPTGGSFSHTGGRSSDLFWTAVLMAVFGIPIVITRLWVSRSVSKKWHPDDILAFLALIFAVSQSIITAIEARLGGGSHLLEVSPEDLTTLLRVARWGGVPLYNLTTVFIKASILAFYLRFAIDVAFIIFTYIIIFVVVAYSLTNVIGVFALDCSATNPDDCHRLFIIYIVSAAFNVATDFIILFMPFWLLRPMKISFGRKLAIALVLMAGGFVVAVSIARLVITIQSNVDKDVTYAWGNSVKWSIIESWSGLICACLPFFRPVFARFFPNFFLFRSSDPSRFERGIQSISS